MTFSPPNFFTPRYLGLESRPFRVDPAVFLVAQRLKSMFNPPDASAAVGYTLALEARSLRPTLRKIAEKLMLKTNVKEPGRCPNGRLSLLAKKRKQREAEDRRRREEEWLPDLLWRRPGRLGFARNGESSRSGELQHDLKIDDGSAEEIGRAHV